MESGLHGPDRHAEDVGDVGQGKPHVVVQDEDRPVLGRQPAERSIEAVAIVHRDGRIGTARSVDRQRRDVGDPSPVSPQLLVTGIDEEAVEPWREAIGITEPRELAPGEEERLLNRVL